MLEANLYAYADNSPITKVDPSGNIVCLIPLVGQVACLTAVVFHGGSLLLLSLGVNNLNKSYAHWCGNGRCAIRLSSSTRSATYPRCFAGKGFAICTGTGWTLAQQQKKVLEGHRAGSRKVLEKLRSGEEDGMNHWERQLRGIHAKIREILKDHPQWRESGDPR